MSSNSVKHIHKVKRRTEKTGSRIYFCTLPDCYFKVGVEFTLGKIFLCNRCGEPFEMNPYSMRLAKPHCSNCHSEKTKIGTVKEFKSLSELKGLLEILPEEEEIEL